MGQIRKAYALVEVFAAIIVLGLLLAVLVPMARRTRTGDGLSMSTQNVGTIMAATHMYQADHAGGAPMRACGYSNGQITGGWDTWNFGGKNCSAFWSTSSGGIFDEPAYARPLNPYLYPARLRRPVGYINSGSGSTWSLSHGHPTAADRAIVQIAVFHSPGDVSSRQRNWPTPDPSISGYDDIGTSYVQNMKWWDDPSLGGLSFTARYAEGSRRIGLALAGANPNFVFVHDQTADAVSNGIQGMGEFGKQNYSVVGWADGRAGHIRIVPGALQGPDYTFIP